jgi:DegT/DnrJ/EryC1/StrS aminotransferase family
MRHRASCNEAVLSRIPFATLEREHAELASDLHAAFDRVLRRSGFILGEEVDRFEEAWAQACGASDCVGVGSGTAALTIALRAAGIGGGDEVIVPAHTYIASALAILHAGAVTVLCDVEDETGLLDPEAAAAAIGPRTAAILVVHLHGQICAMPAFLRLADRHGLALLEDAQAHRAEAYGRRAGAFGLADHLFPVRLAERDAVAAHMGRRGRHRPALLPAAAPPARPDGGVGRPEARRRVGPRGALPAYRRSSVAPRWRPPRTSALRRWRSSRWTGARA